MSKPAIIRFDHHVALTPWPDYPETEIASGSRQHAGHTYFEDKAEGLSAGIWTQDANESHWLDYPFHEFMIILEGEVTIVEEHRSTTIGAGECFVIPKGLRCRWTQKVRVRKVFVILDVRGDGPKGAHTITLDPSAKLESSAPPAASVLLSSPPPRQHTRDFYETVDGRFTAGVWDSTPYRRKLIDFPRWELMHLLEGSVTMTDGDGNQQTFKAGDTFFVPKGASNAWESHGDLRKLFCILLPADS